MKNIEIFDPSMCCSTGVCGPSIDTELMRIATIINALKEKNIVLPKKCSKLSELAQKYHGDVLFAWIMLLIVLILNRFWYYWQTIL